MAFKFDLKRQADSVLTASIPVVTGLAVLALGWRKWPDILGDFGREIYIPWQIVSGAALYQDIAYLNGPFSPYLNSTLFKFFGAHLTTLVFFNIFLAAVLAYIIYRFFLMASGRIEAVSAATVFLGIFAFSQYLKGGNYNFICPYSYDLAHGVFLSILAIYIFSLYLAKPRAILLAIVGMLIGTAFLTKAEAFMAVFTAICAAVLLKIYLKRTPYSDCIKIFAVLLSTALIPIAVSAAFLSFKMPYAEAFSSILFQYKAVFNGALFSNPFYLKVTGFSEPLPNLVQSALSGCWYLVIISLFGLMGYLRGYGRHLKIAGLLIFCVFAALSYPLFNTVFLFTFLWKGLPLAMIALAVYFFRARNLPLFTFTVFAFFLLAKIILNVHVYHYGYALAMPAVILSIVVLLRPLPGLLGRVVGNANFIRMMGLAFTALIVVLHVYNCGRAYDAKKMTVGSGRDSIIAYGPGIAGNRDVVAKLALDKIGRVIGKDETLAVFPEGAMMNYLSGRKNSCRYIVFLPPELKLFGESAMLDSLKANPPDYVMLCKRDTREYGFTYFGLDYGEAIFGWIQKNYVEIETIGNQELYNSELCIIIARRKK